MKTGLIVACCIAEAAAFVGLGLVLADIRAHDRRPAYEVNRWGFQGGTRLSKSPGGIRVALLGGSAAFAAGTPWDRTVAGQIEIEVRSAGAKLRRVYDVVNLAEPQASTDSYVAAMRDYRRLDPDVVCFYDGYDVLSGTAPRSRRRSLVFRATGYLPMLPEALLGRAAWLSDPDGGVAGILLDATPVPADVSCDGASRSYCAAMADAVRFALAQGRAVVVASPPSVSARHALQQQSLGAALTRDFGGNARFAYLDLGHAIDLNDRVASPDGLHLTEVGAHVAGQRIARTALALIGRR